MDSKKGVLAAAVLAAFAGLAAINAAAQRSFRSGMPNLAGMRPPPGEALQTSGLSALGMRRLAADLSFIQLMMYYGSAEPDAAPEPEEHRAGPHAEIGFGTGHYPEIGPRAVGIVELDPFFNYAVLYAAGALAFNLNRTDEALSLLTFASTRDPRYWKYKIYIAGIAFHKKGDAAKVLAELTPALSDPDCPVLIKNIAAFLNRKLGHRETAVHIYMDILKSRDPSYHDLAVSSLRELGSSIPANP